MKKLGFLTCSNSTQDLDCCSAGCLTSLHDRKGAFAMYGDQDTQLVGVINCAGCPTSIAPKKILRRIGVLHEVGVDTIHLASCMTMLCPFVGKYKEAIAEAYPGIELIEGTEAPDGVPFDEAAKMFRGGIQGLLEHPPVNMVQMYQAVAQMQDTPPS